MTTRFGEITGSKKGGKETKRRINLSDMGERVSLRGTTSFQPQTKRVGQKIKGFRKKKTLNLEEEKELVKKKKI